MGAQTSALPCPLATHGQPEMTSGPAAPAGLRAHPPRDLLVLDGEFAGFPQRLEGYVVRALPGWTALRERVRTAPPSSIVLVRAGGGERESEALGELIRETPSVPVVAA